MQVNIKNLIADEQCCKMVRSFRWPEGRQCPFCDSGRVIRRGFNENEPAGQRYECKDCEKCFDDLTDIIFASLHQPLKVWILCLYFTGLNLSYKQILGELDLNRSDIQQMTTQPTEGVVKKILRQRFWAKQRLMRFISHPVTKAVLKQSLKKDGKASGTV